MGELAPILGHGLHGSSTSSAREVVDRLTTHDDPCPTVRDRDDGRARRYWLYWLDSARQ